MIGLLPTSLEIDGEQYEINTDFRIVLLIFEAYAEDVYKRQEFIPYSENEPLQQFVRAVQEQTQNECKNITQSMGFAKWGGGGQRS